MTVWGDRDILLVYYGNDFTVTMYIIILIAHLKYIQLSSTTLQWSWRNKTSNFFKYWFYRSFVTSK